MFLKNFKLIFCALSQRKTLYSLNLVNYAISPELTAIFQLSNAPSAHKGKLGGETISAKNKNADDEIEKMLAQLRS